MDDLIRALNIFMKYGDETYSEDDIIYINVRNHSISDDDIKELNELGFTVDEDDDFEFMRGNLREIKFLRPLP